MRPARVLRSAIVLKPSTLLHLHSVLRKQKYRSYRIALMQNDDGLSLVIPTNRLRDVGETVEQYDEHFWRNGPSPQIIVFDNSTPANQEKYFPLLEQTRTHYDVYYVGPREKEQFLTSPENGGLDNSRYND